MSAKFFCCHLNSSHFEQKWQNKKFGWRLVFGFQSLATSMKRITILEFPKTNGARKLKILQSKVKLKFTSDDPNALIVTKYYKKFGRCYSGVQK